MSFRKRMFARFYDALQGGYEELLGDRRPRLLAEVRGRVLELGPGTGINFEYYPAGRLDEWRGIEPNPHMRERLEARARPLGFDPAFCELDGNRFEADAASFDFVVSTIVLCSVPDPAATLAEVRRVLKPGGQFVFLEHVAAPRGTLRRTVQKALTPCWRCFADGCRLDRELGEDIERAGFQDVSLDRFDARLPHIWGRASV